MLLMGEVLLLALIWYWCVVDCSGAMKSEAAENPSLSSVDVEGGNFLMGGGIGECQHGSSGVDDGYKGFEDSSFESTGLELDDPLEEFSKEFASKVSTWLTATMTLG